MSEWRLTVTYLVAGRTRRSASAWPPGGRQRSRPSPAERGRQGSGSPAGRETQMFSYKRKIIKCFEDHLWPLSSLSLKSRRRRSTFLTKMRASNEQRIKLSKKNTGLHLCVFILILYEIHLTVMSLFLPQSFTSPFRSFWIKFHLLLTSLAVNLTQTGTNQCGTILRQELSRVYRQIFGVKCSNCMHGQCRMKHLLFFWLLWCQLFTDVSRGYCNMHVHLSSCNWFPHWK